MGYLLCGTDMDESTTPLEANAAWAVKLQKGDFIGREALLRQKETGLTRRLTGFLAEASRAIPRNGLPLTDAHGNPLGRITSGSFSPTLKTGIALGYLPPNLPEGHTVYMEVRGQRYALRLTKPPFIKDTSLTRRLAPKT
jgi:aminomethyltransferase